MSEYWRRVIFWSIALFVALALLFVAIGSAQPGSQPAAPEHGAPAFSCAAPRVSDGDTFRCSDGTKVRLAAIDAPEMPGSCRPGRSCVHGDAYASRAALRRLVAGRAVSCEPVGRSYERIVAWCSAGDVDLNCQMVRSGHAARYARHDRARRLCR